VVEEHPEGADEADLPLHPADDGLPFCGFDPDWVDIPISLQMRISHDYGGVVLYGPCPRCEHADGINVFIPTTWATTTSAAAPSAPSASAVALGSDGVGTRAQVQWEGPKTNEMGIEAAVDAVVEIVACRCGAEHTHHPPAGRSGCGYWTYLHLQKE
jgi:hypothetical protein